MSGRTVVVLPAQGDPVARIWLPTSRKLDDLIVDVRQPVNPVHRKVAAWGLTPVLGMVDVVCGTNIFVWVAWVKTDEAPRGFDEFTVAEAAVDGIFGPVVRTLLAAM